jgi:phytoene dehydrogenase-like protein
MKKVVVVGGGHNGLVCAFNLAKSGMKVSVLERRGLVGGACVTEEFIPGMQVEDPIVILCYDFIG